MTKWLRLAAGAPAGRAAGTSASVADCVRPQRLVRPSFRIENPYVPAILSGPETLFAVKRPEPLATASMVNFCTSGFGRCFVFVQRYVRLRPFLSGK